MITGTVSNVHADEPDAGRHQRVGGGGGRDGWSMRKLATAALPSSKRDAQ
jgi:hypothetical protein